MHSEYFQGIVQLRNPNDEGRIYLEKALGKDISKIKKVRNGFDYYIKSNKNAQKVGKEFNKKFGGEFKISRKLYSRNRQTSKEVYRLSVLLRLPGFAKGDVVKINDDLIRINGLAKKLTGTNLKTGKKVVQKYPENFEVLKRFETRVVKVKPRIEVLHPETYQSEPLQNKPKKDLVINEKIKVVVDQGLFAI